jgi:hypothetical protein
MTPIFGAGTIKSMPDSLCDVAPPEADTAG